jgi:hypothetical protein
LKKEGRQRLGLLLILAGVAVPLIVASVGYACANLTVIRLSKSSAQAGDTVAVTGRNFASPSNRRCPCSSVVFRLDKRGRGRYLGQAQADSRGRVQYSFSAPRVRTGQHYVLAEQARADGKPVSGSPARAPLKLGYGKASRRSDVVGGWAPAEPDGGAPTASPAALPTGMTGILLSAALSGSGLAILLSARRRRRGLPVA